MDMQHWMFMEGRRTSALKDNVSGKCYVSKSTEHPQKYAHAVRARFYFVVAGNILFNPQSSVILFTNMD